MSPVDSRGGRGQPAVSEKDHEARQASGSGGERGCRGRALLKLLFYFLASHFCGLCCHLLNSFIQINIHLNINLLLKSTFYPLISA